MSFFGAGFNDPFFGNMHRMMHHQMRDMEQLMDAMMVDPFSMMGARHPALNFGNPRQQMIDDSGHNNRHSLRQHPIDPLTSMMMEPFGFGSGGGIFGGVRNMMQQMEQLQQHAVADPTSHVYTQSTVMSIGPGADGRPRVYEATDSVRKAGDVKETRRTVRDSGRGEERISIGHHIGDRGHVIEKRRDRNTGGRIVEQQEFIGLDEDAAHHFDREWKHATRRAVSGDRYRLGGNSSSGGSGLAIEAGPETNRIYRTASPHDVRRARIPTNDQDRRHAPYQHTPPRRRIVRVEEPPETPEPSTSSSKSQQPKTGPIIEEIE